jgi:hypothetical protein
VQANFWVHVEQIAQQSYTYYFAIRIGAEGDAATAMGHDGTIGFWKDWDKNKTYTRCHIENWLHTISCGHSWNINQLSDSNWWNGPNTIAGMTSCINGASGGTMQQKFLGQYLAQRLNLASGRQSWYASHNITSVSGYGYLLTTNGQTMIADRYHATAREIINSIESKYGKSPTNSQFEVMKNICDALNNVSLP